MQKAHANRLFIENHYAHRAVPISECYGAWIKDGRGRKAVGAISFGKPASYTLCNGICGMENSSRIYELNRLWMADYCPRNSESMFIGRALKFLKEKHPDWIIVSYADSAQGHTGTIYRASNFFYTGKTKPHLLYDNGSGKHGRHIKCEGEKTYQRSVKHRYVYFFNKNDISLLRYPVVKFVDV
jgi:hypothetical protein